MKELTETPWCLSRDLERVQLPCGNRVLHQTVTHQYLPVSVAQDALLSKFNGQVRVEEVLHGALSSGGVTSIREFYDLLFQAQQAGILEEGGIKTPPRTAHEACPPCAVPKRVLTISLAVSLVSVVLGWLAFRNASGELLLSSEEWLTALVGVILSMSLGNCAAAATLTAMGRQAWRFRVGFQHGIPCFQADTRDALMAGRSGEVLVSLAALTAPWALGALAWFMQNGALIFGSLIGAVWISIPFGDTPAHRLIHALFRQCHSLPRCAESFLSRRFLAQLFRWKSRLEEENYFWIFSTYTILWGTLVLATASGITTTYGHWMSQHGGSVTGMEGRILSGIILGLSALTMASLMAGLAWIAARSLHNGLLRVWFPLRSPCEGADAPGKGADQKVLQALRESLLFSALPDEAIRSVAQAMKPGSARAGQTVIRQGDPGEELYLLLEGQVEVAREDEAGELRVLATLGPGDVFGEIALLDQVPRTGTVKALSHCRLLALSRSDFERLLVDQLGAEQIRERVQICAFLRRVSWFADWHPQALVRLARTLSWREFGAGNSVLKEGESNDSFYLIYEGSFEVSRGGKPLAALGPGDFFGEISLLRATPATANVKALGGGRCLCLSHGEFLKFVSQDFLAGMTIESRLESRLRQVGGRRAA